MRCLINRCSFETLTSSRSQIPTSLFHYSNEIPTSPEIRTPMSPTTPNFNEPHTLQPHCPSQQIYFFESLDLKTITLSSQRRQNDDGSKLATSKMTLTTCRFFLKTKQTPFLLVAIHMPFSNYFVLEDCHKNHGGRTKANNSYL